MKSSFASYVQHKNNIMLYVAWKRGLPQIFACFVQSKSVSFNFLCGLDLLSECWQSTLFQIFCCCCTKPERINSLVGHDKTVVNLQEQEEHSRTRRKLELEQGYSCIMFVQFCKGCRRRGKTCLCFYRVDGWMGERMMGVSSGLWIRWKNQPPPPPQT